MTMSSRQTWWVAVKQPDGTEAEPEVAQVWFKDAHQVEEVLRLGDERGLWPDQVRLIERVLPAGRAAAVDARLKTFEDAYWIAVETSDPQRWMEAAAFGKQLAVAVRKQHHD
ncbi:hypothetical protein MKK55_18715 [Methylobacterium sp. J-059]|uniref:hypothetical protein n=1 Tax=Methylobacterium sp. J-059 TaxID=2836643 RepID=UPI001FBB7995|nr:hypothetical protein [Methylobacterium sp. J-059]MCJ2040964.1 hypothetical protein [Methylobacterium sp. J-059]